MRATLFIFIAVILGILVFMGGWILLYPSRSDPKNVMYVLWKADLYKIDAHYATAAMVGDPKRDELVLGKTKAELREKFGLLVPPGEVRGYFKRCYQSSSWKDRDVLFIDSSPWMVVFNDGKATHLVLIKGC